MQQLSFFIESAMDGDYNKSLPMEIKDLDEDLNKQLLEDFTGERTGFLRVGPEGYFLPSKYAEEAQHFFNFKPRSTDTWVVTFPRSGKYWTYQIFLCNTVATLTL